MGELGKKLATERQARGWSLREVERRTGIHNAHLVQIEKGEIETPEPYMLYLLAGEYDIELEELLRLAGHAEAPKRSKDPSYGAALRAIGDLTPKERRDALLYMNKIKKQRKKG